MRSATHFQVAWESRFGAWWQDLGVLFSRAPGNAYGGVWPFRSLRKDGPLKPVGGFLFSLVIHASAIALILQMSFTPVSEAARESQVPDPTPIYLDLQALKELKILRALPVVKPDGPGGRPGISDHPLRVVFRASTVQHPKFTVVLHPMKPENNRQAINQKLAAPELKIPAEQKVPDIVLAEAPAPAKPNINMSLRHPLAPGVQNSGVDPAPSVAASAPDSPFQMSPNVQRPQLPITAMHALAPESTQNRGAEAAPNVASNVPELSFKIVPTVQRPQLPVTGLSQPVAPSIRQQNGSAEPAPMVASNAAAGQPYQMGSNAKQPQVPGSYFAANSLQAPHAADSGAGQPGGAGTSASGDPNGGVVVISVDPGTFSQLSSLAQGNRSGMLAIAPSKPGIGSPGGSPTAAGAGGSGGPGKAGDASSAGVGPGRSGGGAGGAETPVVATFSAVGGSGKTGGVDSNKLLGTVRPTTIYAVTSPTKLRRPPLVVATGPIGGGGLDAYGALHCGKVYTIFLPMPGKSWVLQYCAHQDSGANADQAESSVVQLEVGLIPPAADQQFDFHRVPVPEKDADKMIVLRGTIAKDGSINGVEVYQGVLPEMDTQAALAFSNWKFRPATRASLPISVDVLVGIPAKLPEKESGSAGGSLTIQN
jgi:hypothetical protein